MNRYQDQCVKCICYCSNWDDEVKETMKDYPGEECTNGYSPWGDKPCPIFTPIKMEVEE